MSATDRQTLARAAVRIEELEDVLRDILDITTGWSAPLSQRKRLSLIQDFAEVGLESGRASHRSQKEAT